MNSHCLVVRIKSSSPMVLHIFPTTTQRSPQVYIRGLAELVKPHQVILLELTISVE